MSKDTDRLLGHADEADGIEEYDNPLPDWWLGLFWLTIIWAIGYSAWFFMGDQSQLRWYESEVAAAEGRWPEQAQAEVAFAYSDAAAAAGEAIYVQNCVACHGAALEGGIGPNLADNEWIHGGQAEQILATIQNGVLEKGMLAWKDFLSPDQINQVGSYVIQQHAAESGRSLEEILAAPAGDEAEGAEPAADDAASDTASASGEGV